MNRNLFNLSINAGKVEQKHIRIAIAVGTLVLFALGAGAPAGVSDF